MKTVLLGLVVVIAVAVAVMAVLAGGFARDIARVETGLMSYPASPVRRDLPPIVEDFAERGLAGGRPGVAARLTQSAQMRLKRGANWTGLSATQVIAHPHPGFSWTARMKLGPVPAVRVVDRFFEGEGRLDVRAFGALRIGFATGDDAALGEAMRYLAELPWAPDAILTNPALIWSETPEGVSVRLETSGGPAEVVFTFDAHGDIAGMAAKARPTTDADGAPVLLPWRGQLKDYTEIGGRRIPLQAEVGYEYPDGYESYWRGRITGYEVIGG